MRHSGFTFIEVLVAMLIFVMAVIASVNVTEGSVRATREAREITTATWLLQNVMVELETKLETEGIDKGCEKKKEAKFEAPYERFSWTTYCNELELDLSSVPELMKAGKKNDEASEKEDQIQKLVLDVAGKHISQSIRELHAEVKWMQNKTPRTISLTTHFARYDKGLPLPGGVGAAQPGGTGGSSGQSGSSGTGSGTGTGGGKR